MTRSTDTGMSFDQALQHVIVTAVTQLQPENQRLRHALRVVINYQALSLSNPLITNEHLDALERWMIGKRAAQ
jgi:EAL domain-containing protein (putative c-di-GMP-specific phosphodiesterase class I)